MNEDVMLNDLAPVLEKFDYPCSRGSVVSETEDVTLVLADGTENMSRLLAGSSEDAFQSADDLMSELMSRLPRRAVGEPYQSEGDA
jgi:hypothetical protein